MMELEGTNIFEVELMKLAENRELDTACDCCEDEGLLNLARSGEIFYSTPLCYLTNSMFLENDFSKRYELFVKGIKSCGHLKNVLACRGQFYYYLNIRTLDLCLHIDCDTALLLKYSCELKHDILDDFDARSNIVSQLLLLLGFYQKKTFHGKIHDVASGLTIVVKKFRTILIHPLFANALLAIYHNINSAVKTCESIQNTWNASAQTVHSDRYHTIDIPSGNKSCLPQASKQLMSLKCEFDDLLLEMTTKMHFFGESFIRKLYDAAVRKWFHADFKECIWMFWRIVNFQTDDSQVWTRSVIMLYHCMIVVLGMKYICRHKSLEIRLLPVKWPFLQLYRRISSSSFQSLEQDEEELAENLRKVCTPYGDEIETKLNESSNIFFSMGRLYLKKVEVAKGMEQKLNCIKAAALFHGARVRFELLLKNEVKVEEIRDILGQMESSILTACKGKLPGAHTLMKISQNIKRKLKLLRKAEKLDIAKLEIISESMPEHEARKTQVDKIELVQCMLRKNSVNFKHLMSYAAQKCLEILGKLPCTFAIAGLGSLARQEITLYSDFEHVIILDEGMQDSAEYQNTKEYFRWFAIVFNVIIIGVGETIIRSVGVKSINDIYSNNKKRNWYYDMFTPSGVSIDGMMPHACKTPLGRQELTEKMHHIVELILPVSRMACLLTTVEDLKNGYNLKDVLRQSCFVFGCEATYSYFKQQAQNILLSEDEKDGLDSVHKLTRNNLNDLVRGQTTRIILGQIEVDSKPSYYRPLSVLLSFIGRTKKSCDLSSFDIISNWIKPDFKHDTMWAFAVACELRMKIYAYGNGTRLKVLNIGLSHFVGQSCILNCIKQVYELSMSLHMTEKSINPDDVLLFNSELTALMLFGRYKEASAIARKEILTTGIEDNSINALSAGEKKVMLNHRKYILASCLFRMACSCQYSTEEERMFLKEARLLLESCKVYPRDREYAFILFQIYRIEGRYCDAFDLVKKLLENGEEDAVFTELSFNCFYFGKLIPKSFPDPSLALAHCNVSLMNYQGIYSQLAFKYGRALAMIQAGMENGKKELCNLLFYVVKDAVKDLKKGHVLWFVDQVFLKQLSNSWWGDALATIEAGKILLQSKFQNDNAVIYASSLLGPIASSCYLKNSMLEIDSAKKFELFKKGVDTCGYPKNMLACKRQFCYYLNVDSLDVLLHLDADATLLSKYSNEMKTDCLDKFDVRVDIMSRLLLIIGFYQKKIFQGKIGDVAHGLISVLTNFRMILLHPMFANVLGILHHNVNYAVEAHLEHMTNLLGQALYQSDRNQLTDVVTHAESSSQDCLRLKESNDIFERIEPLQINLGELFNEMASKLYLTGESFITKMYCDSIKMWLHADFQGSIHSFWRIINHGKKDFPVWTRSIAMFLHSVVVVRGMKYQSRTQRGTKNFREPRSPVEWPFLYDILGKA